MSIKLRSALSIMALCLGSGISMSAAAEEYCQIPTPNIIELWPFEAELKFNEVKWSAKKSAQELRKKQTAFFGKKSSPFAKSGIKAALGHYDDNIEYKIVPTIAYSKTLDGSYCAAITGARMIIESSPEVLLARELTERSCIAKAAFQHQLDHHKLVTSLLTTIPKNAEVMKKLKKLVFEVYKTRGSVGTTSERIDDGIVAMGKEAGAAVSGYLAPQLRSSRMVELETPGQLLELHSSCNEEFGDTATRLDPN